MTSFLNHESRLAALHIDSPANIYTPNETLAADNMKLCDSPSAQNAEPEESGIISPPPLNVVVSDVSHVAHWNGDSEPERRSEMTVQNKAVGNQQDNRVAKSSLSSIQNHLHERNVVSGNTCSKGQQFLAAHSNWEMGNSSRRHIEDDTITPLQNSANLKVESGTGNFQLKDPHFHPFKSHPIGSHNKHVLLPSHTTHPMLQQQSDNTSTGSEITWQDWQTTNNSFCTNSISRSPSGSFEGASEEACSQPTTQTSAVGGNKKTQYHKTKLCPWHRDGKCFMGPACNYAHTKSELRPKPDLSKTKLCPEVVKGKTCDRPGCRFAHDFVELRATSTFFKTRICKFWQRGFCPAGEDCRHAHGKEDLRCYPTPSEEHGSSSGGRSSVAAFPPAEIGRALVGHPAFVPNHHHTTRAPQPLKRPAIQGSVSNNLMSQRAPAAATIPSPSFLSTSASTPCAASYVHLQESTPTMNSSNTNLGVLLQQLAEALPVSKAGASPSNNTAPSFNVLKDWISQEVERQWTSRTSQLSSSSSPIDANKCSPMNFGSPTSQPSFEESMLLPQSVWQGLQGQSPMNRTEWIGGTSDMHYDGPDSPSFADAVRRLLSNPSMTAAQLGDPVIPAQFFLEALGEISNLSTAGVWLSERPPICKAPFS